MLAGKMLFYSCSCDNIIWTQKPCVVGKMFFGSLFLKSISNINLTINLCYKQSVEKEESLRKRAWDESKKMWVVAGPAIFTRFSTFGIMVVSQSFIGHIGSTELAAYAIVMTVLVRFANGALVSVSLPLDEIKFLNPNKSTQKWMKFKS